MTYATEPHPYSPIQQDSSKSEASPLGNTKLNKPFTILIPSNLISTAGNHQHPNLSHLENQRTYQGSKRQNNTATITTLSVELVKQLHNNNAFKQSFVFFYLGGWNILIYKGITDI